MMDIVTKTHWFLASVIEQNPDTDRTKVLEEVLKVLLVEMKRGIGTPMDDKLFQVALRVLAAQKDQTK